MAWAFTTVSATVNTTSTAGANATSTATVTMTGNLTTANPALQIGAQVVVSNAIYSVTNVTNVTNSVVTLFPQTGVAVPSIASGTSLTFYNPLLQSGTDTTIGTALAGLASFRSDIINAFIDNVGGYASGATSMVIDNGSGAAPAIAPTPTTTFLNSTRVHRVTSYNAGTRTITFSPALNATIANDASITLFTPGVILNRGDGATGLNSYTVNSTRVRITGTFTQNAWAEQLVIASNCPSDNAAQFSYNLSQIVTTGTVTLNGARSSWGAGTGSVCPTPVWVGNIQGTSDVINPFLSTMSGAVTLNNVTIQTASHINTGFSVTASVAYNNATIIDSRGSSSNTLYLGGTFTRFRSVGGNLFFFGLPTNSILSVDLDGAAPLRTNMSAGTTILLNPTTVNMSSLFTFFTTTTIGTFQAIARNNSTGSNPGVDLFSDGNARSGGHVQIQKQLRHTIKSINGVLLSNVKIYGADTLNVQRFNWFTSGINQSGYTTVTGVNGVGAGQVMPAIGIAGSSNLTSNWDAASGRSYNWQSDSLGNTTETSILLAFISQPNRRSISVNCVSNGVTNSGATSISVDNNPGLFPVLINDVGAPQVNGYFVWAGTRHIITSVIVNTSDYTLGISPALTAQVPDNTALPVQNIWYDCRNKTRVTATIDHPSAGTYAVGVSQIVVDNGAGALLATTPVPYTNFIHAGEIYLITAVSSSSTEHTLTISPTLRASIADNATITLENIPGSDFFDFRTASYLHLPQGQELNLTGTGTLTNTWTLLDDATITQTNKATVDGYTTLTTAAQVYDRAKSWWYDNFETLTASQQGAVLVTRSGTTLNAGSYDLTLATSGSVFALSGNTITINAPTFADTLTTTGTITLNNPSTSQVNYASGIVPAGGTVALAVAGTYDLSGWTFASTGAARTISNTSGGAATVWLNPNQVANVTGSGANLSIVAKPQSLAAPNLADGTRAYAARVQTFTIASTAIDTSTDTITLGNDSQGNAAAFATAAPWTQVAFRLAPGATLPATTGNVLKDGGFYYWNGGKLYTSIANIPGTPVDFTSQGSGNFTLQAETELFNTTVSGGTGLSQSLTQPDGILIRFKATKWSESAGNASATQFLDTRDSLITWSAFTGATVSTTLELEAVHEQIVATSYVQSGKYGQLFPAKRGDQFGGKFGIALEGVGTLQINADDDSSNPAGVELLQDIFLWWCWVRSTEAGIRLASYDTLTAINFTTYQAGRVEVENTDAIIPLIIAGGSISFAGSSNGIAATSNAIYLNVDVLGVVAITGVAAADIRSAVGLSSANLDSQLGDITALVL